MKKSEFLQWKEWAIRELQKQYMNDLIDSNHRAIWLQAYTFLLTKNKEFSEDYIDTINALITSTNN